MRKITLRQVNAILIIIFVLFLAVLLLSPIRPLDIKSVDIIGNSFKAGGEMSFKIDRCKTADESVPGTASRYFVNVKDSTKPDIFISSTDDVGAKGCAVVTRTMDIPAHIKDGEYKLKFVTRYFPSAFREPVTIEYTTTDTFNVKGQELATQLNSILDQLRNINDQVAEDKKVAISPEVEEQAMPNETSDSLSVSPNKAPEPAPTVPQNIVEDTQPAAPPERRVIQSNPLQNILDRTILSVDATLNLLGGR